jgi:hypothetical protein
LNDLINTVNQYDDGEYYLGTDAEQILAEANRVALELAQPVAPPVPRTNTCTGGIPQCKWVDTQPYGSRCTTCGETLPF